MSEGKTSKKYIIEIDNVSLKYNKPTEKLGTLKEFFVKLLKGKLRYNEIWVLNDISGKVKKNESLALIGSNGSGKTTLLKMIAGILEPTKGKIKISGSIAPLINLGAGFDMEATAKENVFLNGAILGFSKKEMKEKYDNIVEFSELQDFMHTPLKNFHQGCFHGLDLQLLLM